MGSSAPRARTHQARSRPLAERLEVTPIDVVAQREGRQSAAELVCEFPLDSRSLRRGQAGGVPSPDVRRRVDGRRRLSAPAAPRCRAPERSGRRCATLRRSYSRTAATSPPREKAPAPAATAVSGAPFSWTRAEEARAQEESGQSRSHRRRRSTRRTTFEPSGVGTSSCQIRVT